MPRDTLTALTLARARELIHTKQLSPVELIRSTLGPVDFCHGLLVS